MRCRISWLALVSVIIGSLVLVSCSESPKPAATSETTDTKPYGSLVMGVDSSGATGLDPQFIPLSMWNYLVGQAVFDTSVYKDADGQIKGGIVERWEISPDGKTHTYYIRRGVKFHDGSDLTAADVKFTYDRSMKPGGPALNGPAWRALVDSVEQKDDYAVVVHLKAAQYELLPQLEFSQTAIVPKKYVEEKGADYFMRNPVGSGPWKLVKFDAGVSVKLEALESHWRAVPKFKNITILTVPDEATRVAMLKTGELDVATLIAVDSVPGIKAAGLRVFAYDGEGQANAMVFYDVQHPEKFALGDVRVRKALSLAIDRKEIVDKLLGGNGGMHAVAVVSSSANFFDPNVLKPDPYDPEGAKKLLAEAGYGSGFKTKLWNTTGGLQGMISSATSGYLRKIGVDTEVTPIEFGAFNALTTPNQKPDIWNSVWISTNTSGAAGFDKMVLHYHSTKSTNKHTKNARLDELIDKVPQTADPAERKRLSLEAAVLAKNEYGLTPVVSIYAIMGLGAKAGQISPYRSNIPAGTQLESITHAK